MSKFDFQLAYTVEGDEADAAKARTYLREKTGLKTVQHIETTLLGVVTLEAVTLADRQKDAGRVVHAFLHDALKTLGVLSTVKFYGCLMVNGLGPAIRFNVLPK